MTEEQWATIDTLTYVWIGWLAMTLLLGRWPALLAAILVPVVSTGLTAIVSMHYFWLDAMARIFTAARISIVAGMVISAALVIYSLVRPKRSRRSYRARQR